MWEVLLIRLQFNDLYIVLHFTVIILCHLSAHLSLSVMLQEKSTLAVTLPPIQVLFSNG